MGYKDEYSQYIMEHVANVKKAFDWMIAHKINKKIDFGNLNLIKERLQAHDLSKWTEEEFEPYAHYFNVKKDNKDEFNKAWNHHQKVNPHHWQYWVLIEDNPEKEYVCIPMEREYIIEMICDWWSFSFKTGNLTEIFEWYDKNKANQKMHKDTRKTVEELLKLIKEELKKEA